MNTQSKSEVILTAEVVGFRRLVALQDADLTSRVAAARAAVIDPAMAAGRILSGGDDGFVGSFDRALDAVAAAVAIQQGLRQWNAGATEDRRIDVRIGIDGGIGGDGGPGDAAAVAAALKGIAPRGGILVSDRVHAALGAGPGFQSDDRGPQKLKGVAAPVLTWDVRGAGSAAAAHSPGGTRKVQPGMIAVLLVVALGIALGVVVGQSSPPPQEPAAANGER